MRRALPAACVLLALAVAGCGGSSKDRAQRPLSRDFVGVVAPELLPAAPATQRSVLGAQHRAGVRLLRQTFDWAQVEVAPGKRTFVRYDRLVGAAARAGIDVLPVIFNVPAFARAAPVAGADVTPTTTFPPRSNARFAAFAATLARRYGPGGSFWRAHPHVPPHPVRSWQIWNEPNLPVYWGGRVDAGGYVALLRATSRAIKRVDPSADIVTAGIPDSSLGVSLPEFIRRLYAAGGRGSFDTLAVHPYAVDVDGVLAGAQAARKVADDAGDDDVGLWITEAGWASGGPGSDFSVGPRRQAQLISGLLRQAAAAASELKLRGVVYFAWRDLPVYPGGKDFWGLHTGMLTRRNSAKPSLAAFASAAKAIAGRSRG